MPRPLTGRSQSGWWSLSTAPSRSLPVTGRFGARQSQNPSSTCTFWPLLLPGKTSCLPLPLPPSQLLLCLNAHRFATHCRVLIHGTISLFRIWPSAAFPSHFVVFFFPSLFAEGHLIWPLLLSRPLAPNPSLSLHKPQIIFHVRNRITVVRHAWQRLWPRR